MDIALLLKDKGLKPKDKTEMLSKALLDYSLLIDDLLTFAAASKDPDKATCIEAIEFATRPNPTIANPACLAFVSQTLTAKAPRVKWESAKVIANIAHLFPDQLDLAVHNLLSNSEHDGTVVRWSAAFALGEILKLKSPRYPDLRAAIEAICALEEKSSIQKMYLAAQKKAAK